MNYREANEKLGTRDKVKLEYETWLVRTEDIVIRLHETDIVTFQENGNIVLNSGGWRTPLTKRRLDRYLDYSVRQNRGVWYLDDYTFADGMTLTPNGVLGAGDSKELLALGKAVNKYTKDYITALFAGDVPAPSKRDCRYCRQALGEKTGSSHILSHIEEEYYVPSLLQRAIEVFPVSPSAERTLYTLWFTDDDTSEWTRDLGERQLLNSLRRYVKRQVGLA